MARGGKKLPGTPAGFGSQAIQTARSGGYGSQVASADAQRAVPVANMAQPPMAPTGAPTGGMPTGFAPGQIPLNMPTNRPTEPLTDGASFGPGRNFEDLALPAPPSPTSEIDSQLFKAYLPLLESVASMPDSSKAMRSFVRRLRAQMPAGLDPTEGM